MQIESDQLDVLQQSELTETIGCQVTHATQIVIIVKVVKERSFGDPYLHGNCCCVHHHDTTNATLRIISIRNIFLQWLDTNGKHPV